MANKNKDKIKEKPLFLTEEEIDKEIFSENETDKEKSLEITFYPNDYFWTEELEKKYRKNPKICYLCGRKIKTTLELNYITTTFPSEPLSPKCLHVHNNCKYGIERKLTLTVR